jgi:hypothetical protein
LNSSFSKGTPAPSPLFSLLCLVLAGLSCCCAVAAGSVWLLRCCPSYLMKWGDSEVRTREKKDAVQNKQTASITAFPFESYTLYFFRLGPLSPEIPTIGPFFQNEKNYVLIKIVLAYWMKEFFDKFLAYLTPKHHINLYKPG